MTNPGIARGPRIFLLDLTGREIFHLLTFLEKTAVQAPLYDDLKIAVFLAERIKPQLREQDYFKYFDEKDRCFMPLQTSEGMDIGR